MSRHTLLSPWQIALTTHPTLRCTHLFCRWGLEGPTSHRSGTETHGCHSQHNPDHTLLSPCLWGCRQALIQRFFHWEHLGFHRQLQTRETQLGSHRNLILITSYLTNAPAVFFPLSLEWQCCEDCLFLVCLYHVPHRRPLIHCRGSQALTTRPYLLRT